MILGLRDTGSYKDQVFENWRRTVLYAFPNGAPLTGLMSLAESEPTNDRIFHWFQKFLPTQRSTLTAAYVAAADSIAVADKNFRQGDQVMNEATGELMEIIGVSGDGLTLTVHRGEWGAAVDSATAADAIIVIGDINAEGGRSPQSISEDPDPFQNYTQIWRSPLEETGTMLNTPVKWDESGSYKELSRQALEGISLRMEKSAIWGKPAQWNDPATGRLKRTTGGILNYIPAGYKHAVAGAGTLTPAAFEDDLELVFRVCSNTANEKLALMGSGALKVLNRIAELSGFNMQSAGDEAFGMALNRWDTPYGTLFTKLHPLFSQHPAWRYSMLIVDVANIGFRPKKGRDLDLYTNRQLPDEDLRKDEFLCEGGFEFHHCGEGATAADAVEGTHMYISNIKLASLT